MHEAISLNRSIYTSPMREVRLKHAMLLACMHACMDTHAMESGSAEARGCKYGGNGNVRQDMPRPRDRNMAPSAARVWTTGHARERNGGILF